MRWRSVPVSCFWSSSSGTFGAGGGGGRTGTLYGGGGGYATGTYAVTPGQTYSVIVGQGGSRPTGTSLSGCYYTPLTYGGGGRGGSCYGGGSSSAWQGSGGGRSAIRASGSSTDLVTAGGGGGGGYGQAGWPGGGTTGGGTTLGGTQTAGGLGGSSVNGLPGTAGTQFLGGNSKDEGGGGGGGYYGGGGGGDNLGGGGGSSYIALLTSGSTTAGTSRDPGLKTPVNSTAPTVGGGAAIGGTLTATAGTWAVSASQTWKWQFSTDGVTFTDISGATSSTYSPTQAGYFRVIETHSNLLGSASGTSTATQVAAPVVTDCTPTSGTFTHCKRFNYYAANQTYTMPSDMPAGSTFQIELWGAGGGGVCCNKYSLDAGGGAGGYQKATITLGSTSQQYTIVVGERGEPRDTTGSFGGGGAGGPSLTTSNNAGSSGGGYAGVFIGANTATPLIIAGGGGGASPGSGATGPEAGGGGGSGAGTAGSSTAAAGQAGTTSAGGAAATTGATTSGSTCPVTATPGSQYQGGRGCGTTAFNSEGGGGGGGGYYGGGGGKDQIAGGAVNGGGGGGSGYLHSSLATGVTSTQGGKNSTVNNPGGTSSDQFVSGIGVGGSGYINTVSGATAGHAMVVFQWAVPPTARADTASGAKAAAITITPSSNDTATSGTTISASSVRLCRPTTDTAPNCTQTSVTITNEGSYSVNTSTGVVTFTGDASFVGTSSLTYVIADARGAKASSTLSFTTLAPPTARADQVAGAKDEILSISPLANDTTSGSATLTASTLKLCATNVTTPFTAAKCTETTVTVAGEGTYAVSSGVVTFTPISPYTYSGTRTLNYVVQDSNSQEATSTISVIALPPPATRAVADTATVAYASTATFTPLTGIGADSAGTIPAEYATPGSVALDNSTLKLCSSSQVPRARPTDTQSCNSTSLTVADQGTWTLSGTTVTFVPLESFSGTATKVTYEICNTVSGTWAPSTPLASCSSSTLEATVSAPSAPSPTADTASGAVGATLTFYPLRNDTASGTSASRLKLCNVDPVETAPNCFSTSVTVANQGTWTLNTSTGVVTFVPLESFSGAATAVRYAATDITGQAFNSTMTATINTPLLAASADSTSGSNDGDIVITPLTNDSGTGLSASNLKLCGSSDTAPTCTQTSLTEASKGEWTLDVGTGQVTFTPVANFVGTAGPITYSIVDQVGQRTTSTMTITVSALSAPTTPDLASASDSGESNSDNITNIQTPTITVTGANSGNTVTVTASKAGSADVSCTFTASSSDTSCDLGTLADGVWSIVSKQTTSGGVSSGNSSALSITIDSVEPTVTRFSTTSSNGTYGVGDSINITATVSETIVDGASITVTLDSGATVVLTKATSTTLTGTYTVGSGESSSDLTVQSYSLTTAPQDTAGNTMVSTSVPSGANNIAGAHALVVNTTSSTTASTTTAPTTASTTTTVPTATSTSTSLTSTSSTTSTTAVPTVTTTSTIPTATTSTTIRRAVTTTTVFRPLLPLTPITTLPSTTTTVRKPTTTSSTTSSTTTSSTTTTTSSTTTTTSSTTTTIAQSTIESLSKAEKVLESAKQSATSEVLAAQIQVADLRLSVLDPSSAVVVAVRDAERTVEKLKDSDASTSKIVVAESKVVELKVAIAELKSISVEEILSAKQALEYVLSDPRATAAEVANAEAKLADERTPSLSEVASILSKVVDDYTLPLIVPGVVDSAGSGNFVMFDGAVQQTLELKRVNESVMVLSSSDGFKISIAAVDKDGKPFEFNSRGAVVVKHGNFISVSGEGFAANSVAKTWLFSSPRELGATNIDEQGRFSAQFRIDEDVRIGDHVSQVNGLSPSGEKRSVNIDVEILPNVGPAPFDPLSQPGNVLTLVAELVTLLAVAGAGRRREEEDERESAEVAEVSVSHRGAVIDRDRDRLRVLAVGAVDRVSVGASRGVVGLSPMLARVFGDGVYLRSILGVLWLVLPFVGAGFGFGAASSSGFDAVMPSLFWLSALVVLGVFDAFSGFVGALVFGLAVGFGGGVVSGDSVRGLLGVWVFCFAAPLIAGAVRPFRRVRSVSGENVWDRCVDFVLIVLFGAWVAGSMYSALPGLTGFNSPSAGYVNHVRAVVLVALAVRFVLENFAVAVTPVRLKALTREPLPEPTLQQKVVSVIVRTGVYMFVAVVFIGNNWALWLGGVLYLIPKLVSLGVDKLPDMRTVHRYLPRGIFKVVLMLFVAKWWGGLVATQVDNPADMIKFGFVLLGIPGLALGAVGWFARSSRPWPSTIVTKLLGTALLIIGVLVVLNIWLAI